MARKDPAGVGDNSAQVLGGESLKQLHALTDRIMQLLQDRDDVNADIKEVFNEAKESGFETKILRKAITKKRKVDANPTAYRAEEEQIAMYFDALWELPLFESLEPSAGAKKAAAKKKAAAAPAPEPETEAVV